MSKLSLALIFVASLCAVAPASADPAERNVVLVLVDGLRWQEAFTGAEEELMSKEAGGVADVEGLREDFWRDAPEERREALMPFLWNVVAKQGQLIGNQAEGSVAEVSNPFHFSYPGYSEMICGWADPGIDSNNKVPNPNVTVLEWLHGRPGFDGRVAAFGTWDVVAWIVNRERCGFFVNTGWEPVPDDGDLSEKAKLLNELKAQLPRQWSHSPEDAITFHAALEYVKRHQPRVLYLTVGETDEFAHSGRYDLYLQSAHNTDAMLRQLWETLQSMEQYRGNTTLIVATDHGRGTGPTAWRHHNADTPGSDDIWIAILGPDTPHLDRGGRPSEPVIQAQVAATVAAAVGEDYATAQPKAAPPIPGAIEREAAQ